MKRLFLFILLIFVWATANAEKLDKPYTVGVGWYTVKIDYVAVDTDFDFSGFSLSMSQAFSDNWLIRGTLFSLENDSVSSVDSEGYDLVLYFGKGFVSQGFKAYVGGGFGKDTIEGVLMGLSFKESGSGFQLSGGIGYNWNRVALDFTIGIRDPDDYEKAIKNVTGVDVSVDAYSGALSVSYRF